MQINTDISPIISPKSNVSISFMSPRDIIFTNIHSTKHRASIEKSPSALNSMTPGGTQTNRGEFEVSQNANTTPNESYSVDRNMNGRNNSRHIASLSSHYNINETRRESDSGEIMKENVQMIEYEEFCMDRSPEQNKIKSPNQSKLEPKDQEQEVESFGNREHGQVLQQANLNQLKDSNTEKEVAPTPKTTNKKFLFNFAQEPPQRGTYHSDTSNNYQQKTSADNSASKRKQDPFDVSVQDSQNRHNAVPNSDICKGELIDQRNFQSMRSSFVSENGNRGEPKGQSAEQQPTEVIKAKDDEIDYLKARIKYLEEKRNEKQESSRIKSETVAKSEKETSTADMLESESVQLKNQMSTEIMELKAENKKLVEMHCELQRENVMLKEKRAVQEAKTTQPEDKSAGYESVILKLKDELGVKGEEINSLLEERKLLLTKKTKLKNLLRQRDQFITEFKLRSEETSKVNQNEAIQAAMDKVKLSKDKISQLQKQLDHQKELINQRDAAIETLLTKLDAIGEVNEEKTNEISTLKNDMKNFQEQIELLKKEHKLLSNLPQSQKGSRENLLLSEKEKCERLGGLPKKLGELERKVKDGPSKPQQSHPANNTKNDQLGGKQFSQLEMINSDREAALLFYAYQSQELRTPKPQDLAPDTEGTKLNTRQGTGKSSEGESSRNQDHDKEIKNIKDLQKRLAYLKAKRNEFERRKETKQREKEELHQRYKEDLQDLQHGNKNAFGSLAGEIQYYGQEGTPFVFGRKAHDSPNLTEKKTLSVEKDTFNRRYLHMDDLVAQTSSGHNLLLRNASNFSDGANSRPSSKTRPPKTEGAQQFNRIESSNIFSAKSGIRYESLSSNTSTVKHENLSSSAKFHKKSYDFNAKSANIFKLSESPGKLLGASAKIEKERSSSRPKDGKEVLYKGLGTPGSQAPSRPGEKFFEGKSKK